ncbi:MAG: hypothetical protein JW931_08230 [Methanomicrobiaceae archaeon]|nr:hypothetical protein [Methanomicrobiaceae archaeon]
MNPSAEKIFKMKFAKLTIMLNVIIILVAVAMLAFFGLIPVYSMAICIACLVLAVVLSLLFRSHYIKDKAWLMEQE